MANQFPNIVPVGFAGNIFDFNKAKVDRSGAVRLYKGSVSVPTGTTVGNKVGLVPVVQGGYIVNAASMIWFDALGASVTTSAGVTYQTGSAQTEAPATYVAAGNTVAAAGGAVPLNSVLAGLTYKFLDNGWITVTLAGATTGSTGNITFNIAIAYDQNALQ